MEQYISKSALVAEIERRKEEEVSYDEDSKSFASYSDQIHYSVLDSIQDFIDTLEVKEVYLEKEWKEFLKDGDVGFKEIAKHFFELGMQFKTETNITFKYNIGESIREHKAQKEE